MRLSWFVRVAMSVEEAKRVFGFPPAAYPSLEEVKKVYKQLALKYHPDMGGDAKKMVDLNLAREVLVGEQDRLHAPSSYYHEPKPTPKAKPEPVFGVFIRGSKSHDGKIHLNLKVELGGSTMTWDPPSKAADKLGVVIDLVKKQDSDFLGPHSSYWIHIDSANIIKELEKVAPGPFKRKLQFARVKHSRN